MSQILLPLAALLLTAGCTHSHELAIPCGHQDNCLCYNVIGLISCINRNLVDFHDDFLEVDRQVAIYLDLKFNNLTRFSFQQSMWPQLISVDLRENPIDCEWLSKQSWRWLAKSYCIIAREWEGMSRDDAGYEDYNSEYGDTRQPGLTPENDESPELPEADSRDNPRSDPTEYPNYADLPGGGWTPYKGRHKTSGDSARKHETSISDGTYSMLILLSVLGAIFLIGLFLMGLRTLLRKLRGKRQTRRGHVNAIARGDSENRKPSVYSNVTECEYMD